MDKTIQKYRDFDAMKADEYRYWQSRTVQQRMEAVTELNLALGAMKGTVADVPRLQRTLVRIAKPWR